MWIFVNTGFAQVMASAKTLKNLRVIVVYHVHRVTMEMAKNVQVGLYYSTDNFCLKFLFWIYICI